MGSFVLLVEDNPSDVGLTRRAFGRVGVAEELVVARDGQEALDLLLARGRCAGGGASAEPSLVLLDLRLPRVDGLSVLARLHTDARTRSVPIVVLTTSSEPRDLAAARELGAACYLRKSLRFDEFVDQVREVQRSWLQTTETERRGASTR